MQVFYLAGDIFNVRHWTWRTSCFSSCLVHMSRYDILPFPSSESCMKTKIENLKTNLPGLHQIPCTPCGKNTPHKVVASHETYAEHTEFDECKKETCLIDVVMDAMQIVRCDQCGTTSFRELKTVRGIDVENSHGVWGDPVTETLYRPDNAKRRQLDADASTQYFD